MNTQEQLSQDLSTWELPGQELHQFMDGNMLRNVANELIDKFIDKGETDLTQDFTLLYPYIVIARLLELFSQHLMPVLCWQKAIKTTYVSTTYG